MNENALSAKGGHAKFAIKLKVTILVEDNPHVAKYQSNLLSGFRGKNLKSFQTLDTR